MAIGFDTTSQDQAAKPDPHGLFVRQPSPAEIGRALHLFRESRLPSRARMFVAVKPRPIERFVAAAAWWPLGEIICFRLAAQGAATTRSEASRRLIDKISECTQALHLNTTQYADLLADDNEWIGVLKENGFGQLRSERFFEVSSELSWTRTTQFFEKFQSKIPPDWRTESIRFHAPEAIMELIAPFRLMPSAELGDYWRPDSAFGFELDLSSILFAAGRPIGTFLARKVRDMLCVDVRVVQAENRLLRSLGNICLFRHAAERHGPVGVIRCLQFRGGATEHLETANLALRMGGHELPPRHVFARVL
jgi:hypothetical protein